jgi:predicted CopG family antitoxin
MLADKRLPTNDSVRMDLCSLKRAGKTYSQLLEEMIEVRKKARLFCDMEDIEEKGEFVEFPW